MEKLRQLIKYAEAQGDLKMISSSEDEERYAISEREFGIVRRNGGYVDEDGLWSFLKRRYPVIEIIELVRAAIECGVVIDVSNGRRFMDLGYDYSAICSSSDIFVFCTKTEEKTYKIVFSHQMQDADNGIEYAHRASVFIDALVKNVIGKYGVLYAESFYAAESVISATLPLHESVMMLGSMQLENGGRTEEPMAQVKVLIRYRDTVGNSTFVENIIDDIFVYCTGDGTVEWSFPKIRFDDRSVTEIGRAVTAEDRKKVYKLRRIVESASGKRAMFSALKDHVGSALYDTIEKRKAEYAESDVLPKVEYSITPLAMYCSYPTQKTVTYKLAPDPAFLEKSNARYSQEVRYSISVLDSEIDRFWVEREGRKHYVSEENPLVLAYTSNFLRDEGTEPVPACLDCVTVLQDQNPDYYGEKDFKNVFFLTSQLRTRGNFELGELAYVTDAPFLISDLKKCEIDGKYYHVKDLREVDVALVNGEIISDGEKKYVRNSKDVPIYTCSLCHAVYGGTAEDIKRYSADHAVINSDGRHCCDKCVGKVSSKGRTVLKVKGRGGKEFYVLDELKKLNNIRLCNYSDELTYGDDTVQCQCCGEYVNKDHSHRTGGAVFCSFCVGTEPQKRDSALSAEYDALWRGVARSLKLSDMNRARCYVWEKERSAEDGSTGYVWVYSEAHKRKGWQRNVYCFIKKSNGKGSSYYLKSCVFLLNGRLIGKGRRHKGGDGYGA